LGSISWSIGFAAVMLLTGLLWSCARRDLDLKELKLNGLRLSEELTPEEVIHRLGRPEEETTSRRWLWRPPRRYLKYFSRGLEFAFDSEGRKFDPLSSKFFRVYIFLRPEGPYQAFSGSISRGLDGQWDVARLEEALGPPKRTRKVFDELEWIYQAQRGFDKVFIADAANRGLKALMILRRQRERPL